MSDDKTVIYPALITSIDDDGFDFAVLIDIDVNGFATLEDRRSDYTSMFSTSLIAGMCEKDYINMIIKMGTGYMETKVEPMLDKLFYELIFDDHLNGVYDKSYLNHIRDYKLTKLINTENEKI